jgi:hypothetical protein
MPQTSQFRHPLRAIQRAAVGVIPDLSLLGYETSLGFSSAETSRAGDREDTAVLLSPGGSVSDGIYSFPGEYLGVTWHDADYYRFQVPTSPPGGPGMYAAQLGIRVPRGFGG